MNWNFQKIRKLIDGDFKGKLPKGVEIKEEENIRRIVLEVGKAKMIISKSLPAIKEVRSEIVGIFTPKVRKEKKVKKGNLIGFIEYLRYQEEVRVKEEGIIKEIIEKGPVGYDSFLYSYRPKKGLTKSL